MVKEVRENRIKYSVFIFIFCSISCYILSLFNETFCVQGSCSRENGWVVLGFGFFGIMYGDRAAVSWMANPLLLASWLTFLNAKLKMDMPIVFFSLILGILALLFSASFFFCKEVALDEGGTPIPLTGYKIGYWLWLASMVFNCLAIFSALIGSKRKSKYPPNAPDPNPRTA